MSPRRLCALALAGLALLTGCGSSRGTRDQADAPANDVVLPRPALRAEPVAASERQAPPRRVGLPSTWPNDPKVALARGKEEGRPTLVVFYAEWSRACSELTKVLADREVQEILDRRFVAAHVDVTDESLETVAAVQAAFGVSGLPTLIVFDAKGKEVARHLDFLDVTRLKEVLERVP